MQHRIIIFLFMGLGLFWFGEGSALEIIAPLEGARLPIGSSYLLQVKPAPGEEWIEVVQSLNALKFNASTGMFELTKNIPKDGNPKSVKLKIGAIDRRGKKIVLTRTVEYVLSSTTTVTGIDAAFTIGKKTFLEIARKPSGELVVTEGTNSTNELSVSASYSDGVERGIASKPGIKYVSGNEKVAIVIPRVGTRAMVKATGPGTTDIIVQYGEFTDRVTVKVDECPYIEGVTDKRGCPIGQ